MLVLLLALVVPLASPTARPTPAALRRAFESNRRALVQVVGPHRSGPGVVVGGAGQVLTSARFVGPDRATIRFEGKAFQAKVLFASAFLQVAMVEVQPTGEFPAAPVSLRELFEPGAWLVALRSGPGKGSARWVRVAARGSPFVEVSAALAPGTSLFDRQGRLVAIAVAPGARGAKILPLPIVKAQLAAGASR